MAAATVVVALFAIGAAHAGRPATPALERLPDLDQETPFGLNVVASGSGSATKYWLGFGSAVRNVGAGPLVLDGQRPDTSTLAMTVGQKVVRSDGSQTVIPNVGRMMFVTSADHRHWHYLGFDRYQLHRAGKTRVVVSDRKSGFCLGDRYAVKDRVVANAAPEKVYRSRCGLNDTELLQLEEGISVGYGDDYKPFLEGQDLPLNGLAAGRYVLVHGANSDRRLRELSYKNNAASVLLDLRWSKGVPRLRALRSCSNSARCERPLAGVRPVAVPLLGVAPRAASASLPVAHPAGPFLPDDDGITDQPGAWAQLQWNFVGPFGVDAPHAWENLIRARRPGGQRVLVAVVDTGVAYADEPPYRKSPDLDGTKFVKGWDFVDNDASPFDENGHGTHVASTIAEQTNNGYALTGLAYGARIMPVRVLNEVGDGYPDVIARGIRYAANHGAQVINLSFNFDPSVQAAQVPEVIKAIDYAHKRGSLVVAATGNQARHGVAYPARASHVLAVGATTEAGCLASYSNIGAGLDLAAPGGGGDASLPGDTNCVAGRVGRPIYQLTLRPGSVSDFDVANNYIGTSMATAHVSAAAALVIASGVIGRHPKPDLLEQRLERTSRDLGILGYDVDYGWGLLNAATATARGKAHRPQEPPRLP